jgi:hypothetical protein
MKTRPRLLPLLLAFAVTSSLFAAACGGDDGGGTSGATATPSVFVSQNPRDQEAEAQRWTGELCTLAKAFQIRIAEHQTAFQQIDLTRGPATKEAVVQLFRRLQTEASRYHQSARLLGVPKIPSGGPVFDAFNELFKLEDAEFADAVAKIERLSPSPQFAQDLEQALQGERTYSLGGRLADLGESRNDVRYVWDALTADRACGGWFLPGFPAPPPGTPAATP